MITRNGNEPLLICCASLLTHRQICRQTKRSPKADPAEKFKDSIGQVLTKLKEINLDHNRFGVFFKGNGPWLIKLMIDENIGPYGSLYEAKVSTYQDGRPVSDIALNAGNLESKPGVFGGSNFHEPVPITLNPSGITPITGKPSDGNDIQELSAR